MVYFSTLPYFQRSFQVVLFARWWSVSTFSRILLSLSTTYFPAHAAREAALSFFDSQTFAPFGLETRFPDSAYVTDADPYLNRLLTQLYSSLNYADRLLNKTTTNSQVPVSSNDPSYLAAKASFFSVLPLIIAYLRLPENSFDQLRFETEYSFTWV